MDPPFRFPQSPGTPLFPISPDRENKQYNPSLTSSSSASNVSLRGHERTKSNQAGAGDVQGKVEKFNSLTKEASERRKAHEAALKRAVVGREEAENEVRRAKEEFKKLKAQVDEGKEREMRVGQRLESVMEELHRTKETHKHSIALYEREVRRARKEAFKSSSALVKLQEDLKAARIQVRNAHHEIEAGKDKTEKREQEAFAARYELVGVQEELAKMRERVKVVEEERDALKTSLREEEVARIAAEGRISLPAPTEDEIEKPETPLRISRSATPAIHAIGDEAYELAAAREELGRTRTRATKAEETVNFMRMECQFRCCSCRIAEWNDAGYVHDNTLAAATDIIRKERELAMSSMMAPQAGSTLPQGEVWTPENDENQAKHSVNRRSITEEIAFEHYQPESSVLHHNLEDEFAPTHDALESTLIADYPRRDTTLRPVESKEELHQLEPILKKSLSDPAEVFCPETSLLSLLATPQGHLHQEAASHQTPVPTLFSPASSPTTSPHPSVPVSAPLTPPATAVLSPRTTIRTITTTVPLVNRNTDTPPEYAAVFSPGATMSREEALQEIQRRRGRTRSVAAASTPKSKTPRRDISAPAKA